jgi:hypothetical protein
MKGLLYLMISSFCLLNLCLSAYSQEQSPIAKADYGNELYSSVVSAYGFDQVLLNGMCYEDDYRGKIGHPFLFEDQFYKGSLVFREREYQGVNLKYDVYKQQVLLYVSQNNTNAWIIPPNDFISAFKMGEQLFVKQTYQGVPRFYQMVFDTDSLKCLYYWSKKRFDSDHQREYNSSKFNNSERITYLLVDDVLKKYRNNSSFVMLFPQERQVRIKQYIKNNKINVAKSSDVEIHDLLSYCNSIL